MAGKESPFQSLMRRIDERDLGFAQVVAISRIDPRQLRNALDRGVLSLGEKHRLGRWAFSLRDCFQLVIIADLTASAWVPISVAGKVAAEIAPHAERIFDGIWNSAISEDPQEIRFVVSGSGNEYVVVELRRGGDGFGYYDLHGSALDIDHMKHCHIHVPVMSIIDTLLDRYISTDDRFHRVQADD